LIIANPPYVDPARIAEVQDSVLDHEPHRALFGGEGGLEVIRRFLRQVRDRLAANGCLYMEFDPQQAEAIRRMLDDNGYKIYDFLRDQSDRVRFVKVSV
jgi:release factor glutamine methyltransferase